MCFQSHNIETSHLDCGLVDGENTIIIVLDCIIYTTLKYQCITRITIIKCFTQYQIIKIILAYIQMLSIEDYKILIPRKAYSRNIGLYCLIIIFTFVRVDKHFGTLKKQNSEIFELHSEICVWKIKLLTMKMYLNLNLSPIPLCRFVCDQEIMKLNKICLSFVDRKTSSTHWILAKTFCLM